MSGTADEPEEDLAGWGLAPEDGDAAASPSSAATAAAPPQPLSQAEIDSLLGLGDEMDSGDRADGMHRIVSSGLVSYERLPMLEIVFDRLVRILSTSMRTLTSDNVEVSIDKIISLRFGDYLNSIPLPALLGVFHAQEWDNYGLMVVDSAMIYSVVDVLLGGRSGTTPMRIEGRPYTTIERSLVEKMASQILADLSQAFNPVCDVTFRYDRTETNPRFAAISRASNAAILVKLRLEMEERGGFFEIVIPYATLEPIRDVLLQQFMGERFGRDNIWETHLAEELRHTDVELDAVLAEQTMDLCEVMNLGVGSQLMFSLAPDAPVQMRCGATTLFIATTGNRHNQVAVQIQQKIDFPARTGE